MLAVGLLAGIGFTVSLLIAELSFATDIANLSAAKVGVLAGSVISAVAAIVVMQLRARKVRV